ncbi:MAG: AmmeMemoRadiSam system protein B [Deltaproteobacteria bacterium]|nr:AmmeMemoRadiSam system protein B [Deltaproteobacteria bacterium]
MRGEVRRPTAAGTFYPKDSASLSRQVRHFLSCAPCPVIEGKILALIVPHAGYDYSGGVAAKAYRLLQGMSFDAVVVVAPSHRVFFHGASVYDRGRYETPLGLVETDLDLCRRLVSQDPMIRCSAQGHGKEHSLEVQLPFLQEVLGNFQLVPLVIGDQNYSTCQKLGRAISRAVRGQKVLLVASTDLSHFHPYEKAVELDRCFLETLQSLDPRKLAQELESGRGEACGGGPVITVMIAARELGANCVRLLQYANSGDITADRTGVVGYAAAVLLEAEGPAPEKGPRKAGISLGLTDEEKGLLRQIALAAVEHRLKGKKPPPVEVSSRLLQEPRGAFVCWKKRGHLRGCIGQIQAAKPLGQTVQEMALAAAFEDPRFSALTPREFREVELEISALTPLERIDDIGRIEIGRHGLYIKEGHSSGLLLPQVAVECGWNRTTFLEETCLKAGLPRDAWKQAEAEIYIFSADVF